MNQIRAKTSPTTLFNKDSTSPIKTDPIKELTHQILQQKPILNLVRIINRQIIKINPSIHPISHLLTPIPSAEPSQKSLSIKGIILVKIMITIWTRHKPSRIKQINKILQHSK
jgi:hypothetical protein